MRLFSDFVSVFDISKFSEPDEDRVRIETSTLLHDVVNGFADTQRQVITHGTGSRDPDTCTDSVMGTFDSCTAQMGKQS